MSDSPEQDPNRDERPWFGPRRFGFGYRAQTWQGYLISAVIVAVAIIIGTTTKAKHGGLAPLIIIPLILVPVVIRLHQSRR